MEHSILPVLKQSTLWSFATTLEDILPLNFLIGAATCKQVNISCHMVCNRIKDTYVLSDYAALISGQ